MFSSIASTIGQSGMIFAEGKRVVRNGAYKAAKFQAVRPAVRALGYSAAHADIGFRLAARAYAR